MPRESRKRSPSVTRTGAPRTRAVSPPATSRPPSGLAALHSLGPKRPRQTARSHRSAARRALGAYGESVAVRVLLAAGMLVLARNWRCREGEVDIVALDGDALVICEVKTRSTGGYEHPLAAVGPAKAERLRRLAARWLEQHGGPPSGGVRIDVVGVRLPPRGAPRVEHVRGVT